MKFCLRVVVYFAFSIYAAIANAEPVIVKASEITKMLTGNTAIGFWNGTEYRQFFNEDGTTIYATRSSQSSLGKWRVNSSSNTYESLWNHGSWDAYYILKQNQNLFWKDAENKTYSFKILQGQQLLWPD